eukprot:CAMPEP_0116082198 /NCGR_PEP_ID=MMETSP0327-20121206/2604_1 /TAXON_ID=44447 /ORGANISM="Pseudo-nitzschia delicatissima, Strain B596" /LENGTH=643 /DNA_ID=CAMNT_0003572987 /DNA_START=748 /DNA_END=2679 /DNA_ORIENTATION=-
MAPQTQDGNHHGSCDESKCVSKSFSHDGSFVCYGNGSISRPMMCADGFLPVITDEEPRSLSNTTLWHFTCCPPSNLPTEEMDVTRHCSDPITISRAKNTDGLCENQENKARKYPHLMKPTLINFSMEMNTYVCCDSVATNDDDASSSTTSATNFLEDIDCVPYKNEFYDAPNAQNQVGMLRPITCDFPDGDFSFPRPVGNGTIQDVASTGQYQCCKTGPALPPFIEDKGFKVTVYPLVALWSIAALLSLLVAVGLLVPIVIQLMNGTYQRKSLQLSRSFRKSNSEARYSTYNLYIVYLAALDVFISLVALALYGSYMDQRFHRGFYGSLAIPWKSHGLPPELVISIFYASSNMWINAIICYEIVILLQSSRKARRIDQPSLCKVNIQVGTVFFFSAIYCSSIYLLTDASEMAIIKCNFEKSDNLRIVLHVFSTLLLLPFLYVVYATVLIWWRGYLPSTQKATAREKAMRELAFFFFRIVAVFILIWFPMVTLFVSVYMTEGDWTRLLCYCLMSIQPILTFCMILTKSDVRIYLWQLVTLSYCVSGRKGGSSAWAGIEEAKTWDIPVETCTTMTTPTREQWRRLSHNGSIASFTSNPNADEHFIVALDAISDPDIENGSDDSAEASAKNTNLLDSSLHEKEQIA